MGGDYPAVLNAVNEEAVAAFLTHQLPFVHIAEVVDSVLQGWGATEPDNIDAVLASDHRARQLARQLIEQVDEQRV